MLKFILSRNTLYNVPPLIWLVIPITAYLTIIAVFLADPHYYSKYMIGEYGFIEIVTLLVLTMAVILSSKTAYLAFQSKNLPVFWLKYWFLLVAGGLLFFLLEEASWGFWIFHWDPPQYFLETNKQYETNLHNSLNIYIHLITNRIPRIAVITWTYMSTIILPWYRGRTNKLPYTDKQWQFWFWATPNTLPVMLMFLIAFCIINVLLNFNAHPSHLSELFIHSEEMQEMCISLVACVYAYSIHNILKSTK